MATTAALASCTPLITSSPDYRTAGARSAGDASSQVASAAQAAQLAIDGRAFTVYLSVVVSDAEDALSGIESTFGELQPPTADDEATRQELLDTLGDAVDEVSDVRITIEAGRTPSSDQVQHLTELQDELDSLAGALT